MERNDGVVIGPYENTDGKFGMDPWNGVKKKKNDSIIHMTSDTQM